MIINHTFVHSFSFTRSFVIIIRTYILQKLKLIAEFLLHRFIATVITLVCDIINMQNV